MTNHTPENGAIPEGAWRCANCDMWSLADRDQCYECGWRRQPESDRIVRRLIRRLAATAIGEAKAAGYLEGLQVARAERPMTCGVAQRQHHPDDYMYDPGQ